MKKRRVYFNEFNVFMDQAIYLPLVSGLLQAYAQTIPAIKDHYQFMPFLFMRDELDNILKEYKDPDVAAFSVSMWNAQLSMEVARRVKAKYPNCLMVFGGPNVPYDATEYFAQYPFVDVTVRGDGEQTFAGVLTRFLESRDFAGVPGISYRGEDGTCRKSLAEHAPAKELDVYPSPYTTGVFDEIMRKNKGLDFQAIVETNRGCPFNCAFCFWGQGGLNTRFRFFSEDYVSATADWLGRNKITYVFCADSNPLVALTIAGASFAVTEATEDSVRIAKWQNDRAGAFAFTFDDGQREQAAIAAPMLDALGLKATFVINPGKTPQNGESWFGSWEQWRALAKNGHEIGNHAMTHENLSKASDEVLQREVVEAKALIEKEMALPCYTFVYPFNAEGDAARALVKKTHPVWSSGERKAYGGPNFTAAKANAWIDEAIAQKSLVIAMIHGIDTGYLPFTGRAIFKDHLDYVKSKESQVWVATLATIKRYAAERDAAKLDVQTSAKKVVITLTCTLDPAIYNVPLTVVIASGPTKSVNAKRDGGGEVTATITGEVILCDVIPGKGAVTLIWK